MLVNINHAYYDINNTYTHGNAFFIPSEHTAWSCHVFNYHVISLLH